MGRIFAHRTRAATGTVSAGNGYSFLWNLRYRGYPRFFSTIKYYYLLEKILIIYILYCCCCSSHSYSLSKNKGVRGRCCCCSRCIAAAAATVLAPTIARPPSFVFTPPVNPFPRPRSPLPPAFVRVCGCSSCRWCRRCSPAFVLFGFVRIPPPSSAFAPPTRLRSR